MPDGVLLLPAARADGERDEADSVLEIPQGGAARAQLCQGCPCTHIDIWCGPIDYPIWTPRRNCHLHYPRVDLPPSLLDVHNVALLANGVSDQKVPDLVFSVDFLSLGPGSAMTIGERGGWAVDRWPGIGS